MNLLFAHVSCQVKRSSSNEPILKHLNLFIAYSIHILDDTASRHFLSIASKYFKK